MIRVFTTTARRCGRSAYYAAMTAAYLKAGKPVILVTIGDDGKPTYEPIVGVPGFDDGRQITDQRKA